MRTTPNPLVQKTLPLLLGVLCAAGCERNLPQQGVDNAATNGPGQGPNGAPGDPSATGGPGGPGDPVGPAGPAGPDFGNVGDEEVIPTPGGPMPTPGAGGGTDGTPSGGGGPGSPANPTPGVGGDGQVVDPPEDPPMVDTTMTCEDEAYVDPTEQATPFPYDTIESQVSSKLGTMTLAEKAAMMGGPVCEAYWCTNDRAAQFSTPDVAGVSGFKFRDGPRGLSEWEEETNANRRATAFPVSVARAASFDLGLEYRIGAAICTEALASGWNNVLAPTVNLTKHPAAGRAQESYGEDPWLSGKMGTAFVVGCQQYAQACPKHYAGNEVETGRVNVSADMDDRTLRENYTRPFEMIIKGADPACIMASYNSVNGTHSTEHAGLLKDLLRTEFGFNGFVVSDWAAVVSGAPSANAGMEVEMPERVHFNALESLVNSGQVQSTTVDTAVRNILKQKYRFGFGATASNCCSDTAQVSGAAERFNNTSYLEHADHLALVEEAARKGAVLLKNEANAAGAPTLPITPDKYATVAVLAPTLPSEGSKGTQSFWDDWEWQSGQGSWANAARMGDKGSSQVFPSRRISPLQAFQERAPAGISVITGNTAATAAQADVVIVVAALTSYDEGEEWQNGGDRESLDLQDGQAQFIMDVAAQGKPMIVMLEGGAPITMENWKGSANSIVMAWYTGMTGTYGIADLLYGTANFSGRLPQTWPVQMSDAGPPGSGVPRFTFEYLHGYRHFEANGIAPLFPFGYGLSYTSYAYNNLTLPCGTASKNSVVRVSVEVSNTGSVAGTEVVQVYVGFPGTVTRPTKEYKAAVRVDLEPGITKRVTVPLPVKDWTYFDSASGNWAVESGEHTIYVGPNSRDIPENMIGTINVQ